MMQSIGSAPPLRYVEEPTVLKLPPTLPRKWVRNQMPECMFGGCGYWICAVCVRMGFDLRYLFCPIREQASAEAKGKFETVGFAEATARSEALMPVECEVL